VSAVSNLSLIVAVLLLLGLNLEALIDLVGSGALAAALLLVTTIFAIGYAFGGPAPATRSVLALGTGQRNIAAALIVAARTADDSRVVTMLLASTLVGLLVVVPAARYFARHMSAPPAVTQGTARDLRYQEVTR
jgi:BASS family bile acid:Na+ symporter